MALLISLSVGLRTRALAIPVQSTLVPLPSTQLSKLCRVRGKAPDVSVASNIQVSLHVTVWPLLPSEPAAKHARRNAQALGKGHRAGEVCNCCGRVGAYP